MNLGKRADRKDQLQQIAETALELFGSEFTCVIHAGGTTADAVCSWLRILAAQCGRGGAEGKNPAAVALGKRGGPKGGRARARKLSKKRLSEIGKKGAHTRWNLRRPNDGK